MAYDEDLADRIRELVATEAGLTEREMFGGLSFLVRGTMSVAASGQGGLLARVDPAEVDDLIDGERVRLMEMGGRTMNGWLHVDSAAVAGDRELATWVERSVRYAKSLPAK